MFKAFFVDNHLVSLIFPTGIVLPALTIKRIRNRFPEGLK